MAMASRSRSGASRFQLQASRRRSANWAERTGAMLAISLHATNDDLRNELVPINKKYNLQELFDAIRAYPGLSQLPSA